MEKQPFNYNDIVYLVDDVTYDKIKLNRGQQFFVLKHELNRVECIIDGNDEVFVFSPEFITDNPSDVLWSKAFFRVLFYNIAILLGFGLALIVIFHLLLSS